MMLHLMERGRMTIFRNSEPGLIVEQISHSFSAPGASRFARRNETRRVLANISFDVPPGTLTAIVGPSGCGKSTLLRMLAGLIVPESGRALAGTRELMGNPGGVAYHPQRDALLPWLRALDNATLGAETCGRDRASARLEAFEMLDRFGLTGHHDAWPDELSGGMRQRVALMRTFLMPQPVLALDEPLGALDALTRRNLQDWLLDIVASERRATLLVTHDIDEALLLADQIHVMSGRPGTIMHTEERPSAKTRRHERETGADRPAAQRLMAVLGRDAN